MEEKPLSWYFYSSKINTTKNLLLLASDSNETFLKQKDPFIPVKLGKTKDFSVNHKSQSISETSHWENTRLDSPSKLNEHCYAPSKRS